jgi:hypothetical protein
MERSDGPSNEPCDHSVSICGTADLGRGLSKMRIPVKVVEPKLTLVKITRLIISLFPHSFKTKSFNMARSIALAAILYALPIMAKTDLEGCTSFTSTVVVDPSPGYGNTYETVIWYVSDTLEICKGVDCGGGRAPPRSVPGCPIYKGTETVTPEFLDRDPMAPMTTAPSKGKASQVTEPTVTSESEAEETETESMEVTTTETPDDTKPTETFTKSTVETKEQEPETTAVVSKSVIKSNETMTQTQSDSGQTSASEETPTASSVDADNAGAGVMVKAAGVLAGFIGALVLVL